METLLSRHWHHLPVEEVAALLETDLQKGLSQFEVQRRQEHFGPNAVTPRKRMSALKRFLLQFSQPLVYILMVAGVVTALLKEGVDACVIFGVVIVNALVGFIQESKAEKAIESLKKLVSTEATVLRNGKKVRVSSVELVPGDIVLLQSGDKVPADLRLTSVKDLQVDESALTGESVPVEKVSGLLPLDTILADRLNMAYAGTLVTYGQGEGVVIEIGDMTETGRISHLIAEAPEMTTPLGKKLATFSKTLLVIVLALAALTFVTGVLRGGSGVEMFMASVALAVAAIPEGLPAAVTIMLAIGVRRMASRRAIIRKLPAVETLGSASVICSDKTGTLTENQMTVQRILAGGVVYEVTGSGYAPEGQITQDGKPVQTSNILALKECLAAGMLCNDSQLIQKDGAWEIQGDPTEGALIVSARKGGLLEGELSVRLPRIDSIPFESERQYMATLHTDAGGQKIVYLKGAAEKILDRCTSWLGPDGAVSELRRDEVLQAADKMASDGLRVLAFARGEMPADHKKFGHDHVTSGLTFLGLQAMIDPPRPEAIAAIGECKTAGITVKMITGDHALTAVAIGEKLGLCDPQGAEPAAITGRELERFSDEDLVKSVITSSIFARVAPEQKLRLVEVLQSRGEVVAMTGDGVNDAPALKQADIGIAMGITGTEVAKEAADMILTDDNFASIVSAVREGRRVFDNLVKFITWTLPTNVGEGLLLLTAILFGVALPIMPVQILWINMMTALLLGLMLAFEKEEPDIMLRPPRPANMPILTRELLVSTLIVALIMQICGFGLFMWNKLGKGFHVSEAQTVVVNVIVFVEIVYLFNCRSLKESAFKIGFFSNPWVIAGMIAMIVAQFVFTYSKWMNRFFHTAPITVWEWVEVLAVAVLAYVTVEGLKRMRRRAIAHSTRT